MKFSLETLNITMTNAQIEEICNKVEKRLQKENGERWNAKVSESITEKMELAGRTKKTDDDRGNGLAEILPSFIKEYTKLFVQQALVEIFCDENK